MKRIRMLDGPTPVRPGRTAVSWLDDAKWSLRRSRWWARAGRRAREDRAGRGIWACDLVDDGFTVVSGLAAGFGLAAHEPALAVKRRDGGAGRVPGCILTRNRAESPAAPVRDRLLRIMRTMLDTGRPRSRRGRVAREDARQTGRPNRSELLREALQDHDQPFRTGNVPRPAGFRPIPMRVVLVTNELVNDLRDGLSTLQVTAWSQIRNNNFAK